MQVEFVRGYGFVTDRIKIEHLFVKIKGLVDVIDLESYLSYVRINSS